MRPCVQWLSTRAKTWKQPKCPSVDEWIKQLWYIYTMEYYLAVKKEKNFIICNSMDTPGEHYAKCNMPAKETQTPCDFTHIWESNEQTEQVK